MMHLGEGERGFAEMHANYRRVVGSRVGKGSFWHLVRTGVEDRGWVTSRVEHGTEPTGRFGPRGYRRHYSLTLAGHEMLQRARDLLAVRAEPDVAAASAGEGPRPGRSPARGRHHGRRERAA
jgi:hypothetical protein